MLAAKKTHTHTNTQKGNYAFQAYLFACLTVIEKDASKKIFHSPSYSIDQWRNFLGVEEGTNMQPWRMKQNVFERIEKSVEKRTKDTNEPIKITFIERSNKTFQMKVERKKK